MNETWPEISLMDLYAKSGTKMWNEFLSKTQSAEDIHTLKKTLYGVQKGMARLAKEKLNTPEMIQFFIRIQRSLEITAKKILRKKYPNPLDNSLNAKEYYLKFIEAKRQRDHELELFLRGSSY